jgi:hypothetical protein
MERQQSQVTGGTVTVANLSQFPRRAMEVYENGVDFLLSRKEKTYSVTCPLKAALTCKIWRFHGGDYEDFRLSGYKNPVPTSQETHHISATQPSQLMLCKIWGFHGSDYEECCLLGCYAVLLLEEPTFRRNVAPLALRYFFAACVGC